MHGGDPADTCHVVVPSLPGFALSTPSSGTGWEVARTTEAYAGLMTRLYHEAEHSGLDWLAPAGMPTTWAVFDAHPLMHRVLDPWGATGHWTEYTEGGYFPATEVPELLVADLRELFRGVRG